MTSSCTGKRPGPSVTFRRIAENHRTSLFRPGCSRQGMAGIQLPVTMGGPAQAQRNFGVCPMHHRRHCSGERRTHKPHDTESSTHVSHTLHVCYLIGDALFTMALHVATSQEGHREGCANPIRPEDHVTSRRDPRPFGPRLPRKGWQEGIGIKQ